MAHLRKVSENTYVAVDIKQKKIIAYEVTTEEVHDDGKMLEKLVDRASENNNVKEYWLMGFMYDNNKNFRYL